MAQALSGFATEGTQYAMNNSYYLLDTVPGAGNVLDGPITVAGNLVVTGTETVQGALGVAGNVNAPSMTSPAVLSLTGANGLSAVATTGNVGVTSTAGTVTVTSSGNANVTSTAGNVNLTAGQFNVLVSPTSVALRGPSTRQIGISALFGTTIDNVNAPLIVNPSISCVSYLNGNTGVSSVTKTEATAIVTTPAQFNPLRIGDITSAPITIPITPLFANGCVPKFVKLTMSPITFGSIITGACSVTQPFNIYFYQGTSTSWDVISSQSLFTFTYTNQVGTISTVGSYVTIPSVTFPSVNGSQIDPAGGPIQVWYYTYFQGFFGPATGTQTTFTLSVAL